MLLREFEMSDAKALFSFCKDEDVGRNAGWQPHRSLKDSEAAIELFKSMYKVWAIVLRENHALIGSIGLHKSKAEDIKYDMELGYSMSKAYWNKGIMTEAAKKVVAYAFEEEKVKTLYVSHFPDNIGSRRVIEKCGFSFLKVKERAWENYDGAMCDLVCYTLTRAQYVRSVLEGIIQPNILRLVDAVLSRYNVDEFYNVKTEYYDYELRLAKGSKTLCSFLFNKKKVDVMIVLTPKDILKFNNAHMLFPKNIVDLCDESPVFCDDKWLRIPTEILDEDTLLRLLEIKKAPNKVLQ